MCAAGGDCSATSSCVAGRCVANGAAVAIGAARRVLYDPVAIGFVRRGAEPGLPAIAALGRSDGALALLRFSLPLPPEVSVIEAYLLLDRATNVDSDPAPIALHAVRIVDPWDERSLSWAVQPRVEEVGSPITRVLPSAGALVRLDVRAIVERWRRREGGDFGLAVVSDAPDRAGANPSMGMAFALGAGGAGGGWGGARDRGEGGGGSGGTVGAAGPSGPRLELYLR
jgi:hypothetical protein